jgi:hypothetical protein
VGKGARFARGAHHRLWVPRVAPVAGARGGLFDIVKKDSGQAHVSAGTIARVSTPAAARDER